jgi:WD40 repeat protein
VSQAWDGKTGKLQRIQKGHKGWVSDMVFISEARVLVTSSVDGSIFVWSDKGKELQQMDFGSAVFCMAFNAKRSTLAVGGNGNITIYRVTRPDPQDLNNLGKSSYIKVDSDSLKVLKTLTTISPHTDMIKGIVAADNGRIFSAGSALALPRCARTT